MARSSATAKRPKPQPITTGSNVPLTGRAADLWREVQSTWSLDAAAIELLRCACESLTRADECAAIVNAEGTAVRDRWGQVKVHPVALLERDLRGQAARQLAALGLSLGE
jgi:hypothetical protein